MARSLLVLSATINISGGARIINKDFKIQLRDGKENGDKTIGLISKTTALHVHHTFLHISFQFLHDYDVKMPNFAFYGGRQ